MITSKSMKPAYPGNAASNAESQQSVSGKVVNRQGSQQPAHTVGKGNTRRQSSPPQTEHEYIQDEDRMQCEHCGFWYHA